jgi:HPt (histidine-containing phosphotransfer) domain-containing protein
MDGAWSSITSWQCFPLATSTKEIKDSGVTSRFSHPGEEKISVCEEKVSSSTMGNLPSRKNITSDLQEYQVLECQVFYLKEVLERAEGDEVLLKEMIILFLDMFPELLASMDKAVKEGENESLRQSAHTLKSAAGSIGANRVFRASYDLKQVCRENDRESITTKLGELKIRLLELEPVLIMHLKNQII